jgi:virginiamycin A acetyltransferase
MSVFSIIRYYLWRLLGVSQIHMQWVCDNHYLKEDDNSIIGYKSYDNNAIVYRWSNNKLIIGKYCSISYGVKFVVDDGRHTFNKISNYPFKTNRVGNKAGIIIGNDVWIGLDVTILNGVKIGDGATVAAGSVVISDVPPYSVVAGVPAKVVKRKCTEDEAIKMTEIAWWNWEESTLNERIKDFELDIPSFIHKYG